MSTRFTALTVSEGDAFLLEDNGWKCLFDSGADRKIIDLLEFKGIDSLDLAICSHNDADHADGFIQLLKAGFPIKEIWLPGLWANVLLFVKENCHNCGEVELDNELYDGELRSLFSNESVSEESFNQDLSYWGKIEGPNILHESINHLHGKLARQITENSGILESFLEHNLQKQFDEEYNEESFREQVNDYLEDVMKDCITWRPDWARMIDHNWYGIPKNKKNLSEFIHLGIERLELNQQRVKQSLDFKLEKIIRIAILARKLGVTIRWFEPSSACTKEKIDYGLVSLNSNKMCRIRMPKSSIAYMYLLHLTKENKYSLVFEYTKKDAPIIRFSADSNSTCQSVSPYPESIIVTAPHHGSSANAKVYNAIQGDNLVWVRSDWQSSKRPCKEFKNSKNKFCLACRKYNFISEICFEYNTGLKKWECVHGEQCRCK